MYKPYMTQSALPPVKAYISEAQPPYSPIGKLKIGMRKLTNRTHCPPKKKNS